MHPAVLHSLSYVIRRCKKYGVETSICGQAASKLEMARFLVGEGIDSISVNADAARKVSELVAEIEKSGKVIEEERIEKRLPRDSKLAVNEAMVGGVNPESPIVPMMNGMMKEEEIILKALEEYVPSKEITSDVPPLNDAIPISEEDFKKQEDEVVNVF